MSGILGFSVIVAAKVQHSVNYAHSNAVAVSALLRADDHIADEDRGCCWIGAGLIVARRIGAPSLVYGESQDICGAVTSHVLLVQLCHAIFVYEHQSDFRVLWSAFAG